MKRQKNDAADAEAICEAVTRPNMRFVEIKSPEQQGVQAAAIAGQKKDDHSREEPVRRARIVARRDPAASIAVILDALNDDAVKFYKALGFTLLPDFDRTVFLLRDSLKNDRRP